MSKSLLDGIEFGEKRKAVDADWTKARKVAVGSVATLLAVCALGAGAYFAWDNRPVRLPKTASEAVAVINSGRVDRLSSDRKKQYFAEASRLMEDVPAEDRRDLFRDEESRDAMRQVMMEQMDTSMREIARGDGAHDGFPPAHGQCDARRPTTRRWQSRRRQLNKTLDTLGAITHLRWVMQSVFSSCNHHASKMHGGTMK